MGRQFFDNMNKVFCLLFCYFIAVGCCRNDSRLERALVLAKDNRGELERVLAYYRMDSLKLQAAKFLIENMPGHLSYQGNEIDRYYDAVDAVLQEKHGIPIRELVEEMNGVGRRFTKKYNMVSDLEVVTADYLIENIEDAFRQWEKGSWSMHVSFQDFCEWMLPYKVVELQPLDGWRFYLKKRFDKGLENLQYCYMYEKSAVWATCCINSNLKDSIRPDLRGNEMFPVHRLSTKLRMPFGVCQDYVEVAAARKGIPGMWYWQTAASLFPLAGLRAIRENRTSLMKKWQRFIGIRMLSILIWKNCIRMNGLYRKPSGRYVLRMLQASIW